MGTDNNIKKFIDLVRRVSGRWTNWDPLTPIKVGDYGTLSDNGEFNVEGNIYDDEFQRYLNDNGININLKDHQPKLGDPDQDYIKASAGVKGEPLNVNQHVHVPMIISASIKGTWKFQNGKRGALVILHAPREHSIPPTALTKILEAKLLEGKQIVTSALVCPAYLMYLSEKAGETFSAAFSAKTAGVDVANSEAGIGWWTNNDSTLLRRLSNPKGEHRFTPLFSLKKKAKPGWWPWRGEEGPDSSEWQDVFPSWKPLDEDGEEIDD